MRKFGLFFGLLIWSFLLSGCLNTTETVTITATDEKAQSDFTGYYFTAATPTSTLIDTDFSVIDPGNTPLRTGMILMMPITGFINGDIVKVYYGRDYEELEKLAKFHTPTNALVPYNTEKIGSLKDELFIPRDNDQYKLQTVSIENPIIKTKKGVCHLYEESINETVYEYTYPDLGIRITTPECWDYLKNHTTTGDIFVRNGSTLFRSPRSDEYLTIYTKDPNQPLEEVIRERHLNPGCKLDNQWIPLAFREVKGIGLSINGGSWSSAEPTKCYSDDQDDSMDRGSPNIGYFEPDNDKNRYYKLKYGDACAPGPCTIFGKIETL
ncbi:MAG: hypothetical protein DLD55_00450 [candidate division SR1 bacterium]|nr:MAG: hypothetical protein DLD55_00450 [candidate division SR1 bacterium]